MPPGDVPRTWADGNSLREAFGDTGHTNIRQGIPRLIEWTRHYKPFFAALDANHRVA